MGAVTERGWGCKHRRPLQKELLHKYVHFVSASGIPLSHLKHRKPSNTLLGQTVLAPVGGCGCRRFNFVGLVGLLHGLKTL